MGRSAVVDAQIRQRLDRVGVTPTALAELLGVSVPHASMMLSGVRGFSRRHYGALAKRLALSAQETLEIFFASGVNSDLPCPLDGVKGAEQTEGRQESSYTAPDTTDPREAPVAEIVATASGPLDPAIGAIILQARYALRSLAREADEWEGRLRQVLADYQYDPDRQQNPVARPRASGDAGDHRDDNRRS